MADLGCAAVLHQRRRRRDARADAACCRPSTTACARSSASARCTKWCPASATRSWSSCARRPTRTRRRSASTCSTCALKRVDLPQEVSESVYSRMEAERKRVANELRSTGAAESEKIRADADRQREVILAKAYRDAQRIKGEGDAKASAIYARAFEQNPEFYAFYRSLEAYRRASRTRATCWCSNRIRSSSSTSRTASRPSNAAARAARWVNISSRRSR